MIVAELTKTVKKHQDKHSQITKIAELVKQSSRNGRQLIAVEMAKTVSGHSKTLSYTDWISDRYLSSRSLRKFINVETLPLSSAQVSARPPLLSEQDCALTGRAESKRTSEMTAITDLTMNMSFCLWLHEPHFAVSLFYITFPTHNGELHAIF